MAGPARSSGYANYSSSSASGFIPEYWSGKLIEKMYPATVFGDIANTDYEGEIKNQGDTVKIRTAPNITIRDYEIGQDLVYETPTSDLVELQINKAKYFGFQVASVDAYQSDLDLMNSFSEDAGEQMAVAIDRSILGVAYAEAAADNAGATAGAKSGSYNMGAAGAPVLLTKDNIIDFIVDTGSVLYEQDMPGTDRKIVLPVWACGLIKKSEIKDASISGDGTSVMRNGRIGMIDNYTVYSSNNLSTVTDSGKQVTNAMFCHKKALTFAAQMTEMDEIPHPTRFGRLVRGLNVYGSKVIDKKAMGHAYIAKG
ncbi:MAG: hypothetical protein ACPGMR_03275 [Pontibacterium sp.]